MTAIQRLMALAGAADVDVAKTKLNADISRAMNMVQKSVSNGDGSGKEYQAKLMALRTQLRDCTTMSQVQKVRDQLNEAQSSRRSNAAAKESSTQFFKDMADALPSARGNLTSDKEREAFSKYDAEDQIAYLLDALPQNVITRMKAKYPENYALFDKKTMARKCQMLAPFFKKMDLS